MKKAVLFVHNSVGGAERMSVLIGKMLQSADYDVRFYIVNQGTPTSNIANLIPDGFVVSNIPECKPFSLIKRLYSIIKDERPDYVFSSVLLINDKVLPLRLLFPKTKFIIRCENYLYTFTKKQRIIISTMYRWADTIIAQTQEMKDELVNESKISSSKIVVWRTPLTLSESRKEYRNAGIPTHVMERRLL